MAEFVEKQEFIAAILQLSREGRSGFISAVTENNRSIMLRFHDGLLIQADARSRDVLDVICVLNDSNRIKFIFSDMVMEAQPSIMPIQQFVDAIILGSSTPSVSAASTSNTGSHDLLTPNRLTTILGNYIGLAAGVIVEQAFEEHDGDIKKILNHIWQAIPDKEQADEFKKETLALIE